MRSVPSHQANNLHKRRTNTVLINRTIKYKNESHSFHIVKKKGVCTAELDGVPCEEVRIVNKTVGSVEIPVRLSGDALLLAIPHERAKIVYLIRDGIEIESGHPYRPVKQVARQLVLFGVLSFLPTLLLLLPDAFFVNDELLFRVFARLIRCFVMAVFSVQNAIDCTREFSDPIKPLKKRLPTALGQLLAILLIYAVWIAFLIYIY